MKKPSNFADAVPGHPQYRRHIATNSLLLGELALKDGNSKEALQFASVATAEYHSLLVHSPHEIAFLKDTVYAAIFGVDCAVRSEDKEQAVALSQLAVKAARAGVDVDRQDFTRWQLLIFALRQQFDHEVYPPSSFSDFMEQYISDLEFVHRSWPDDVLTRAYLAKAYTDPRCGNRRSRKEALQLIEHLDPNSVRADALPSIGMAYLRAGELDAAEACFEESQDDGRFAASLALVYAHRGKIEEAKDMISSLNKIKNMPYYRRIVREIDQMAMRRDHESSES